MAAEPKTPLATPPGNRAVTLSFPQEPVGKGTDYPDRDKGPGFQLF